MIDIVYIGNSYYFANVLLNSKLFRLKKIIYEQQKTTIQIECSYLQLIGVADKDNLKKVLMDCEEMYGIMYDFGIIISPRILYSMEIFNIHGGSLITNRGSSPINWSILLGEKKTSLSVYKITEKVDLGILLQEIEVDIKEDDKPSTLRLRMEKKLPECLEYINQYLGGKLKGVEIKDGLYRPRITESDYTIDLKEDTIEQVKNKIYSQADYSGAIVWIDNRKVRINSVEEYYRLKSEGIYR